VHPDACYRCPECGRLFVDSQVAMEIHLAGEHGRLRDDLTRVLAARSARPNLD